MLGNILAVGLMSLGMGLSSVKDEPKMAQNSDRYAVSLNCNYKQDEAKKKAVSDWLENYIETNIDTTLNIKTASNNGAYTYVGNELKVSDDGVEAYVPSTSPYYVLLSFSHETDGWEIENVSMNFDTSGNYDEGNAQWNENVEDYILTIYNENLYNLLVSYQASDPTYAGENIISAITSGLGIIASLATEFLVGFTNLFYTSGALTPFAIFSLVMLGIAVSFAVVKLVLALIRSNTGA